MIASQLLIVKVEKQTNGATDGGSGSAASPRSRTGGKVRGFTAAFADCEACTVEVVLFCSCVFKFSHRPWVLPENVLQLAAQKADGCCCPGKGGCFSPGQILLAEKAETRRTHKMSLVCSCRDPG